MQEKSSIHVPGNPEELLSRANAFEERLRETKSVPLGGIFHWYPYNTLSSLHLILPLIRDNFSAFTNALEVGSVLDIGCGDGDLSYFFAASGSSVTAIDLASSNFNWMNGVHALRDRLAIPIEIRGTDVDEKLEFREDETYGLVLLLGILYHLKNPFHIPEKLARSARYCFLSTRVAQRSTAGTLIRDEPLAYLLQECEANNDPTNYWVFSNQGLFRLLQRSGWRILGWRTVGCTQDSNPADSSADERMFLFLRSQFRSAPATVTLLDGWTEPVPQRWAWTEKRFSFEVKVNEPRRPESFLLGFQIPEAIASISPVTIRCSVNGQDAGSETFREAGAKLFENKLPQTVRQGEAMKFEFAVEHQFNFHPDPRDLGIVVPFTGAIRGTNSPILFWLN